MSFPTFDLDPDGDYLDFVWDWSKFLAVGDTVSTYTVTPSAGLLADQKSKTNTTVTAWVKADVGATGPLTALCHIVTAQGRTTDQTLEFRLKSK